MTPWSRTRTLKWTPVRSRLRRQMKSGLPETDLMPGFAWNRSQKTNRTVSCSPVNFVMLEFLKRAFIILYMYNNCLNYGMKSTWALGRSTEPKLSSVQFSLLVSVTSKGNSSREEIKIKIASHNSVGSLKLITQEILKSYSAFIGPVSPRRIEWYLWLATNLRLTVKICHQKLMPFLCSRYQSEW